MKKLLSFMAISILFVSGFAVAETTTDASVDELLNIILSDLGTVKPTTSGTTQPVVSTTTETPVATAPTTTGTTTVAQPVTQEDPEFLSALSWMYTRGLTQFSVPNDYNPQGNVTRQQAAKFFVVFQDSLLGAKNTGVTCSFTDTGFDSTLQPYVLKACSYGIMMGKDNVFRPNDKISRSEFTTALVRMILGKKLDETTTPWWLPYYMQARDWGLTKEANANAFDGDMSRYAAALLLYRAVGIVNTMQPNISTGTTTETPVIDSGVINTASGVTTTGVDTPIFSSLLNDPALQEAVFWLNDLGITKYTDINDYRPFDSISRQEAAKMFVTFRYETVSKTSEGSATGCEFTDLADADQTLVPYITQACTVGILKGSDGKFQPFDQLTRAQAVSILLRITDGYQDESSTPRWLGYYNRAIALGMISTTSAANFEQPISRYEIAMLLYKSKIQRDILGNLNNNFEKDKLIFMVSPTGVQSSTGSLTGLVSINVSLLETDPNNSYTIDLFGSQYKITKTVTQKYLNNDYVWYGKVGTLDATTDVGTVALTISNGVIISGVIRPYVVSDMTYSLKPSTQQPYYTLTRTPNN